MKGGALQAAVSFIHEATAQRGDIAWYFALSPAVLNELEPNNSTLKTERITVLDPSPAKSSLSRKKLNKVEEVINPDAIFTFFGPAYVKFKAPHLCGVANGWVTHSNWLAFKSIKTKFQLIKSFLRCIYLGFWYRKASHWVVEAECARKGLATRMLIPLTHVDIVKNTCATGYLHFEGNKSKNYQQKIRILTLSAYYPHKNLEIIPHVASKLRALVQNDDFEFVITIPHGTEEEYFLTETSKHLGVSESIKNLGPVRITDGPRLYSSCHIMFLPSLLETFSANYPEAMAMGLPIVTSDLAFARVTCKDAALYFPPKDAETAADCIASIINNESLRDTLVSRGKNVLTELPTPQDKYFQYESIIRKIVSK